MKANELMIGDWVQIVEPCKYAGAIGRIKTLIYHKDDENAYFKVFLKNNTIHIGIEDICSDDIRPIPLTAEMLSKLGFKKKGNRYGIYDDYFDFEMHEYNDGIWVVSYHCCEMSLPDEQLLICYIHQLQHFMRHCVIDKEIEL